MTELFNGLATADITVIPIYLQEGVVNLAGTPEYLGDVLGTTPAQREEAREYEALFDRKVRNATQHPWQPPLSRSRSCCPSSASPS